MRPLSPVLSHILPATVLATITLSATALSAQPKIDNFARFFQP